MHTVSVLSLSERRDGLWNTLKDERKSLDIIQNCSVGNTFLAEIYCEILVRANSSWLFVACACACAGAGGLVF